MRAPWKTTYDRIQVLHPLHQLSRIEHIDVVRLSHIEASHTQRSRYTQYTATDELAGGGCD